VYHGLPQSLFQDGGKPTKPGVLGLYSFCFNRLSEDGTPVPKHVTVDTFHKLYFITCSLLYLYFIVLYCIVLYCIVLHLYFIVLYCIALVLYCIVLYCIVLHLYFIVLYCIVLYCTCTLLYFRECICWLMYRI
jgi:hypothetical protein